MPKPSPTWKANQYFTSPSGQRLPCIVYLGLDGAAYPPEEVMTNGVRAPSGSEGLDFSIKAVLDAAISQHVRGERDGYEQALREDACAYGEVFVGTSIDPEIADEFAADYSRISKAGGEKLGYRYIVDLEKLVEINRDAMIVPINDSGHSVYHRENEYAVLKEIPAAAFVGALAVTPGFLTGWTTAPDKEFIPNSGYWASLPPQPEL